MLDFLNWLTLKRDTPPGSLVYAGKQRSFSPTLAHCAFGPDGVTEQVLEDQLPNTDGDGRTHLIQLTGVHDPHKVKQVGEWLDIHPLLLEDIMNTGQHPKLNPDEDALFMVFKDVDFNKEEGRAKQHQLGIYWSGNTVLTFQEHRAKPWEGVLARIRSGKGRIRAGGPAYLTVALVDAIIDKYYVVLGALNERGRALEDALAERMTEETLMQLYALKREVVLLRSSFTSARDMLEELSHQDASPIPDEAQPYLDKVRVHAQQVTEAAAALHDILSDMLSLQLSLAGMHMNNVMKVLTIIATIFIPLTFLAGIYGMNFDAMPELHWRYGYPALMGLMVVVAGAMVIVFKRRDWF